MTVIKVNLHFKSFRHIFIVSILLGTSLLVVTPEVKAQKPIKRPVRIVKNVAKSTPQSMNIILKLRNINELNNFIYQTTSPNSVDFRDFMTPKVFAKNYGQSNHKIKQLVKYLQRYHLKTSVEPGNMVVQVSGSTVNFNRALKVTLHQIKDQSGRYQKLSRQPRWPSYLNSSILDIVGLAKNDDSTPKGLSTISAKTLTNNRNDGSPQKFMDNYNLTPLYKHKHLGEGQSIGIITFGGYRSSDINKFWRDESIPYKKNRLKNYYTTQKVNKKSNSETTLDVQQAGAMAPKANLNVYISQPSVNGMVSSLARSISSNRNSTLSISWGQSEHKITQQMRTGLVPKTYNQVINQLLMQAAAQGISVFAASGDSGAYDGMNTIEEYPYLTVDTPANSPYLTAVGGTTLPSQYQVNGKTITVLKERAWANEYFYSKYRKNKTINSNPDKFIRTYFLGSGGGFSKFNAVPNYQQGVSGVGTFEAQQIWGVNNGYIYSIPQPKKILGTQSGRNVPDLVANADPNTGYDSYYHGNLVTSGGTSVVAPQFAGACAVINGALGERVGFWNPQIYQLAQQNDSPFTRLDSDIDNTNLYYTGQPGKVYNQATGLGTVDFAKLKKLFREANY